MKSILTFEHKEAKDYFLKEESYCNFDLPTYFKFQTLLDKVSAKIGNQPLSNFLSRYKVAGSKKTKQRQPSKSPLKSPPGSSDTTCPPAGPKASDAASSAAISVWFEPKTATVMGVVCASVI